MNVASGYKNTDAVNVGHLKMVSDRLSVDIANLKSASAHYLSINSRTEEALELERIQKVQADYDLYVDLESQYLTYLVRAKYNDESFDLSRIEKMLTELDVDGRFSKRTGNLNALKSGIASSSKTQA